MSLLPLAQAFPCSPARAQNIADPRSPSPEGLGCT
eukprot:CAMPEP_0181522450 /NCGR_PEP_ID=MMETSP1110-20121109/67376_1 /TAXON_ID=174948 /ORGANISM="Symbiodinium sp., Strain CCMP421" /LENGTH=34 /DNA_ID= /DNA_START= /DNA_END= /DNA_ORIENTATION=